MKKRPFSIASGILILTFLYVCFSLFVPANAGDVNIEIQIPKGATLRHIADILAEKKLIRNKYIFLALGRITASDRKIRTGYYSIWGNMSAFDIFRLIRKGQIIEYEITITEGESLPEIADKLSKTGIISKEDFMNLSRDENFLSEYDIESPSFEGYLFPDTYLIPKGIDPEDAIGSMIRRMREKYSYELQQKTEEIEWTENQVLTLASIIEKEAVVDSERPLISAVYHNRLRRNMPLQADPTCVYGIKSSHEKITKVDLMRKTPYNTYVIKGLPPGPIASPGLKSIIAALNPAKVPYLYFVSADDRSHVFSSTAAEHLEAVKNYRQRKQEESDADKNAGTNGPS